MEIIKTKTVKFEYDGLFIAQWLLKNYAEKFEHLTDTRAERFAMYDIVNNLTDEYTNKILSEWVKKYDIEHITFKDWETDCEQIWEIIKEKEEYNKKLIEHLRGGNGISGYGVYDKKRNEFTEAKFAEHMETVIKLLKRNYAEEIFCGEKLRDILKRSTIFSLPDNINEEVENFIKDTFEMINGMKSRIFLKQ